MKSYSIELERQVKNRTLILQEAINELEKTKSELNNSLAKEQELGMLKSRFVSMASHEFRTPLATILSSLSLVKKYGEKNEIENQNRHIGKIKSSITNLTDILNDFLSVSKLEEGKVELASEEFNLKTFITEIISELQGITKEGQTIRYTHTGDELASLDKRLLKNIMFNLASNAIKFSPEGKPIEIESEVKASQIKITVKDSGIGISKEDQKHLFERFFRGNNAAHIQGTGLGLNIVSKYIELMNGSIEYSSEENKGTKFIISFPK
jgi:signal transduction histidine kinase